MGLLATPPASNRIAWDKLGWQLGTQNGTNLPTWRDQATMTAMNGESYGVYVSGGSNSTSTAWLLSPEPYDITHFIFGAYANGGGANADYLWSTNTTNGIDGTWNAIPGATRIWYSTPPSWRVAIQTASPVLSGLRGLRVRMGTGGTSGPATGVGHIHLYGAPTTIGDILQVWHPTTDTQLGANYFDFEDIPRGSSSVKTFRIKNRSATLNATGISLGYDILVDASPTLVGQVEVSLDGVSWSASVTVPDLAPGAISGTLYLRWTVNALAVVYSWAGRIKAVPTAWTP